MPTKRVTQIHTEIKRIFLDTLNSKETNTIAHIPFAKLFRGALDLPRIP